jgi:hypothetical protein
MNKLFTFIKKYYWIFAILCIVFIIYMIFDNKNKYENRENYEEYKNTSNNEIHFITLWEKDNSNAKKRLYSKIKEYDNNNIRIIKNIALNKNTINELFQNVGSGGKHNLHDIEVFIIEVPNIYKENKTHDYPEGELVNDIMYSLKTATRGQYSNYKVAHGSYNLKEVNDFLTEYFKYLGDFNNYEEIFNELNDSNIFWFFDRVTLEIGNDIDLVTDSLPASNFLLRRSKISNKAHTSVNNTNKLVDLQDFDSNYYPKEWLEDIKNNNKLIIQNNIQIPTLKDHFMLGLYHMYIHKNGQQDQSRLNKLNDMKKQLNYDTIDITILFDFINENNYSIQKPTDKEVGFHIENKTRGGDKKIVYKYQDRYFYLYKNKEKYNKYLKISNLLHKYNFIPKIIYKNDNSLVIEVENTGEILNKSHNITDFKSVIGKIKSVLEEKNLIHNDIILDNITTKQGKIYLIDFDHAYFTNEDNKRSKSNIFCRKLPDPINDNLEDYINNNECLYRQEK